MLPAVQRRWDRGMTAVVLTFLLCLPLLTPRIYAVDSVEYYAYLPSWLFDHDVDFTNEYARLDALNPLAGIKQGLLDRRDPLTGRPINLAPIGTALLWAPAFAVAHIGVLVARGLGATVSADGFSKPYFWAIALATALYGLAGLLLAYRLARRYTSIWAAAAATITACLATPVVFFMYVSPPWSHVPALFIVALFITLWAGTRGRRSAATWIALGLLGGLMTLSREQLGLFLLLPALEALGVYWELFRRHDWWGVGRTFATHLVFLVVVLLMLVPQFLVYRSLNGRWGPSTIVSQKLMWWSPHFFDTLLDPAHGALLWTPVWIAGVIGLPLLWTRDRGLTLLLGFGLLAQVYINGCFQTWHLTGSFGFRRLIEATPIFVLGIALLVDHVRMPHWAIAGVATLLILWNVGLIGQWSLGDRPIRNGLVWQGMLKRQAHMVALAGNQGVDLLFRRCKFVQNGRCP